MWVYTVVLSHSESYKIAGYAIGSVLLPLGASNKTSQLLKSEFHNLCQWYISF